MIIRVGVLFSAMLAAPVLAQEAAPAMTGGELPVCSKEVRDRCVQGPAAQRMQAEEYKGGGRDNSARMSARQASAGMKRPD
ncbi:hypothetical protein [Thermaurantiacus sp.]